MPDIIPYSHGRVADKISAYFSVLLPTIDESEQLRAKAYYAEVDVCIKLGICYGLSIVYSYMLSTGKEDWWLASLTRFVKWDENLTSLTIEDRQLFERIIDYMLFSQADNAVVDILNLNQDQFLVPALGFFDSELGKIQRHLKLGSFFTETTFTQLFQNACCDFPGFILIMSESHTCSIKYEKTSWSFYNCNSRFPPQKNLTAVELYEQIIRAMKGKAFTVEMASWDAGVLVKMNEFKKVFHLLFLQNPAEMLQQLGVYHFIKESSHLLGSVLIKVDHNEQVRTAFFSSLSMLLKTGETFLDYLTENIVSHRLFRRIINIAQKNPESLEKLISAFDITASKKKELNEFMLKLGLLKETQFNAKRERESVRNAPHHKFFCSEAHFNSSKLSDESIPGQHTKSPNRL